MKTSLMFAQAIKGILIGAVLLAPAVMWGGGATDEARDHWAYQPVTRPQEPTTQHPAWIKTPVDAFVLAKLEAAGLRPSGVADRETLLRRVTFDLIGLPPTTEELRQFLADPSPRAFETVVDRLLRSPHFGERWGRYWLDTARYSDTAGNTTLTSRDGYRYSYAWSYRDYVIRAFNVDKPYDQFILEQLAADKLPHGEDNSSLAALGFLTVGERFPNKNDVINDRIDAVTKGFLGLTVACARCHDHKFDPIPTEDYYSLHGIFNSIYEPAERPVIAVTRDKAQAADYAAKLKDLEEQDKTRYYDFVGQMNGDFRRHVADYLMASVGHGGAPSMRGMAPSRGGGTMRPTTPDNAGTPRARRGASNSTDNLPTDPPRRPRAEPTKDIPKPTGDAPTPRRRMPTPQAAEPAMAPSGRGAMAPRAMGAGEGIDRGIVEVMRRGASQDDPVLGPWWRFAQLAPEDLERNGAKYAAEVAQEATKTGGRWNRLIAASFANASPKTLADVAALYGVAFAGVERDASAYLAAKRAASGSSISGFDPAVAQLLEQPMAMAPGSTLTTERLRDLVTQWPRGLRGLSHFLFEDITELDLSHPGAPAHAMVVVDSSTPTDSPVFIRGQAEVRGQSAPRRFLEVLSGVNRPLFKDGSGRLELARAIADRRNPLTARVLVNRVWMHLFGQAFVPTPDDLGVQSEKPSHPELLDWLASYFMDHGWSQKELIRLIVLSNTYQQSSRDDANSAKVDANNRLLWRANMRRLDFEATRDALLVFSGKLDPTVGGKPINLTDEPYSFRRSVYGYVDRGNLPELMQQFDFPDPDMPNSKRASTVTPQQALFFMNSSMVVDVARRMVGRSEFTGALDDTQRVAALYRIIFQRAPSAVETQMGLRFVGAFVTPSSMHGAVASGVVGETTRRRAEMVDTSRAAVKNEGERVERRPLNAWESYAQALLMTNEVVYLR